MKHFIAVVLLFPLFAYSQTTEDSLRLKKMYGESETYDAALKQIGTIGQDAPWLSVVSADGYAVTSNELSDKVLLVHFWFLTCGGCIVENPLLNRISDSLKHQPHFQLLAFANNSDEELRHFLIRDSLYFGKSWQTIRLHPELSFPVYADPDEQVFSQFRGWAYPANIIIDRNGVIRKIIYRHELDLDDDAFVEYLLSEIKLLL